MKETLGTTAVEDTTMKGQHPWSEQNEPQLTKRREH